MTTLYVAGVAMTKFGPMPGSSVRSLTAEAVEACLDDAGATAADVEAAYFSNTMQGVLEGQLSIAGQIALRHTGIEGVPVVNVENACASGSTALWMSRHRVQIPIYALTTKVSSQRKMALFRNVRPLLMDTSADRDTALAQAEARLKSRGIMDKGDVYAITCGEPMGSPGGTNMLRICEVR